MDEAQELYEDYQDIFDDVEIDVQEIRDYIEMFRHEEGSV